MLDNDLEVLSKTLKLANCQVSSLTFKRSSACVLLSISQSEVVLFEVVLWSIVDRLPTLAPILLDI